MVGAIMVGVWFVGVSVHLLRQQYRGDLSERGA